MQKNDEGQARYAARINAFVEKMMKNYVLML
jgi:hypothetical protein